MDPLATVIIPTFNRRRFLRSAVLSVLPVPRVEVVVVDDGSTDGSLDTIADLGVRCLRFPRNRGIAAARNAGISAARGEFVFFLDSDDRAMTSSLLPRVRWLQSHPLERGVIGLPAGEIDGEGRVVRRAPAPELPPLLTLDWLRRGNRLSTAPGLWCFRREALRSGFDPSVRIVCDTELILRMLEDGPLALWPKPVCWIRHHGENISRQGEQRVAPPAVLAESYLLQLQYQIPLGSR